MIQEVLDKQIASSYENNKQRSDIQSFLLNIASTILNMKGVLAKMHGKIYVRILKRKKTFIKTQNKNKQNNNFNNINSNKHTN